MLFRADGGETKSKSAGSAGSCSEGEATVNPRGEFLPGASCSVLDEREYLYDWRSQEAYLGCHYINFSAALVTAPTTRRSYG